MILILSTGYSGTKFTANYFGIDHEPRKDDYKYFWKFVRGEMDSEKYIESVKLGNECNSNLLPHIDAIEKKYPHVGIIHLVRNPKDTVRSLMSQNLYVEVKDEQERFEKCVDWWVYWHKRLDRYPLLRAEDLKGTPLNKKARTFPPYSKWTPEQKKYFKKTDKLAKKYGYCTTRQK